VIEEGGYALMKHATFNIKGVPVFYTPYMVVPVKNTRQTGFLIPEFSQSDNSGFGFNIPFFWNINDSVDMTFFPEYYTDRGFMPGAEFRYVKDAFSKGSIIGSYIDDDKTDPSETEYYDDTGFTHTNSDRYWVRGKADHTFANNWIARLDLDIVSDRDYLTEFNSGYTGYKESDERYQEVFGRGFDNRTDYTRENTLKFQKSWDGQFLEADFLAINDTKEEDVDSTELWELPSIGYEGLLPIGDTNISFEWDADYVNYWREEGVGGHRVDIRPALSSSIPLSPYLESRGEVGVRGTYYIIDTFGDAVWEKDDTQDRLLADAEFEVATTLMRTFDTDGDAQDNFDHQFRPYVKYNYIPDVDQDDLPSFDSVDNISEENEITYGIDNYFNTLSGTTSRQMGFVKLYQSYDLRSSESDEPFSDVSLRINIIPIERLSFVYETDFDTYGDGFTKHRIESYYTNSRGDYFSIDYSFNDSSNIEQINGYMKAALFANWHAELELEHSISEEETNVANVGLMYQALCWSVEFQTRYTPEETKYLLVFNLANIGTPLGINY
jgi:LPS-assembly protein